MRLSPLGVRRILSTLADLGVTGLGWRLAVVAWWSFLAGTAQAALLITVTELVAGAAQGRPGVVVHGYRLSAAGAVGLASGLLAIYAAAAFASAIAAAGTASGAVATARVSVVRSYFHAGWSIQADERLGHVQQLLSVNCDRVGTVVTSLAGGSQAALSVVALTAAAIVVDPPAAVVILVMSVCVPVLLRPVAGRARAAGRTLTLELRDLATLATEYSRLAKELRVVGVTGRALGRLEDRGQVVAAQYRRTRVLLQASPVAYQAVALTCITAAAALLAVMARSGAGLGGIAAVLLLTLRSLTYGTAVQQATQAVRTSEAAIELLARDVRRYRGQPPGTAGPSSGGADRCHDPAALWRPPGSPSGPTVGGPAGSDLLVEGLSFSYEATAVGHRGGRRALEGVSFSVPDGSIVGVVGRSGSGKTTLGELILGLRSPLRGRVLVGGVPATELVEREGPGWAAVVSQDAPAYRGTVAENIAFFRDIDRGAIVAAAKEAHLHDEIMRLPRGYDTRIGDRGTTLSGGQRQRLAIARALAGRPRLLVLDEPTSALDGWSEHLVAQTVAELRGRATVVVVSHRRGAVAGCELLLVLDEGRVVAFGPADHVVGTGLVGDLVGEAVGARRSRC